MKNESSTKRKQDLKYRGLCEEVRREERSLVNWDGLSLRYIILITLRCPVSYWHRSTQSIVFGNKLLQSASFRSFFTRLNPFLPLQNTLKSPFPGQLLVIKVFILISLTRTSHLSTCQTSNNSHHPSYTIPDSNKRSSSPLFFTSLSPVLPTFPFNSPEFRKSQSVTWG